MNSDRQFHFDLDRYTRTHGLFDAKRARLAPEAIELLAREVVERLAAARIGDPGACGGMIVKGEFTVLTGG